MAGNFNELEILDFGYNLVENQHNLICARNFRRMKTLVVTGNPFALKKEHKGLEMEIFARTGILIRLITIITVIIIMDLFIFLIRG